jgi:ribonuclease P protein subunit RPR2
LIAHESAKDLNVHSQYTTQTTHGLEDSNAMGKGKSAPGVQGRPIYSRASYLYQAAAYLEGQAARTSPGKSSADKAQPEGPDPGPSTQSENETQALKNLSRQLLSDMRSVTLKAQIRQTSTIKRTICKYCDTLQIEGKTAISTVENQSREGRKPWADVLVIRCKSCSNVKRYPVSAARQKRKSQRWT